MGILDVVLFAFGFGLISMSFITTTHNIPSAIYYKVFPFIIGCYNIFMSLYYSNMITLNI